MNKDRSRITRRINLTALGRHSPCLRKACAGSLRLCTFQCKASGRARRLSACYTAERKSKIKNEIVWPSAIGGMKKRENALLWRPPKLGPDSSVRPSVWPSANGGSEQRKRNTHLQWHPKGSPDSSNWPFVWPAAICG
jgi:hypothetical protein